MLDVNTAASKCFNSAATTNVARGADLKHSYVINCHNIFIGVLKLSALKEAAVEENVENIY